VHIILILKLITKTTVQVGLEVVGDGGEVDLDGGFGETSPSHSAQAVAALPCPEDLLDPAPYPMDWLIPFFEPAQRFLFVAAPHAGSDNAGDAALCPHGRARAQARRIIQFPK
jgi:hypothetical protein